ncbi:hypothetical protein GCM10010269_01980 [Streptomyces humidus]|uniref:Uncharacterized protein n=1 Tax=Streptomyces humidus TaxID=52259 RepID=A0A918FRE9_9ACTN|nr:hypothetical protein [Streptomyces humidus]GGR66851.1 hypothetical protein GCM10010269_01980 [Streptomyces humidus]
MSPEQAATAVQPQLKSMLGQMGGAAWNTVAVTAAIGVNDVTCYVRTVVDASRTRRLREVEGVGAAVDVAGGAGRAVVGDRPSAAVK